MADKLVPIFELAGRQHGVVSSSQLRALGLSRDQIASRAHHGWLARLHRGVYAVGHQPLSWRAHWMAAVLACGNGAVLSHRAAGALWRLIEAARGRPIDVTVPTRGGRASPAGLAVHRARSITADETTRHHGIPVTTPARTLLDLAAILSRRRLERAIDEAERLRLCRAPELTSLLDRHRGRTGAVALAAVLADHRTGATLTRSQLEEAFLSLCREYDLPVPLVNEPLLDCVPDFLWPDARVLVEVDGRATHGTPRAFQEDRARDARLTAAGYRPLRFTYRDVVRDRAVVANRVRTVLRLADG